MCSSRFQKLDSRCQYAATASEETIEHVFDPMAPHGKDPVWAAGHPLSDLYPSAFWNTTMGSNEVR